VRQLLALWRARIHISIAKRRIKLRVCLFTLKISKEHNLIQLEKGLRRHCKSPITLKTYIEPKPTPFREECRLRDKQTPYNLHINF
jgi:hypothetical protein